MSFEFAFPIKHDRIIFYFYFFSDGQMPQTFSSSSEFKTKIIIEQRNEIVQPNVSPIKNAPNQPAEVISSNTAPVQKLPSLPRVEVTSIPDNL